MRKQTDYEICKADDSHVRKIVELFKKLTRTDIVQVFLNVNQILKNF